MKRIIAVLLAVVLLFGVFAIPAAAATQKQTVTNTYIDTYGKTIAASTTSAAVVTEAPLVSGYVYLSQSTKTTNVYAQEHIVYIQGYPDGGVKVERNMVRSEAVAVLYRLYNGNIPAFTKRMSYNTFSDVTNKAWYYKELETLYNVGIIDDGELFRPDDPITRAEFAVMCARYDGLTFLDASKFSDVTVGHWAYSYINAAAEKGWINGYPDGTFRPDNYILRSEVMSLVNRLFNRTPATSEISNVKNPYNDITTTHWAYPDVIEATVKHDAVDWHGAEYNNGIYNILKLHYVDTRGNKIAEPTVTTSAVNHHPTALKGYAYQGYITEITYVYTNGTTAPGIEKTASAGTAAVEDSIKYAITLTNGEKATDAWRDVVATDKIPEHMSLVHGSVYIGNRHADYDFEDGLLSVKVGNVEIGKSVKVTFEANVLSTGYGATITNEATGTGSNGGPVSDKDDGLEIDQGEIRPFISKAPDTSKAVVGQSITYTINFGNLTGATYPWENAVITDTIPAGLAFTDGSVYLDGISKSYSFKNGILSVELGDIAPGESHKLLFKATVQESAYACTIHKSQGSEYASVIINIQNGHYIMLKRPLLYTAITRAKERVVIVGDRKAMITAIRTVDAERRGTMLAHRIISHRAVA